MEGTQKQIQCENNRMVKNTYRSVLLPYLCWILPFFQEIFFGFGKKLLHCKQKHVVYLQRVMDHNVVHHITQGCPASEGGTC